MHILFILLLFFLFVLLCAVIATVRHVVSRQQQSQKPSAIESDQHKSNESQR